jgi:hypothetical protein
MKKILLSLCLFLVACQPTTKYIVKPEIVYVDRPVYVSPPPPEVKKPDLYISKLTDGDVNDPGKVVLYWHADIEQLLSLISIYESILDQYKKANVNTQNLQKEVDEIYFANKQRVETITNDSK